jgi:hypothetical protein
MSALSSYIENLPRSVRLARLATVRKILGGFSAGDMIAAPVRRKHRAPGAVTVGMPGTGARHLPTRKPRPHVTARLERVRVLRAQGLSAAKIAAATGMSRTQTERDLARVRT